MLEVLKARCAALASCDLANDQAVKEAEAAIVAAAMVCAGYSFDPGRGQYVKDDPAQDQGEGKTKA